MGLISIIALCIYGWIAAGGMGIVGFSDSADYLFFADFYRAQFSGQPPPEAVAFYRATRFPPLFPLLLAVFGGGTHDLQWTQVVSCTVTLCMFVMLWVWVRRETANPVAAATITALIVLSPGLFLLTLNPVSEPLAMGMTWLVFFLAAKPRMTSDGYILLALIAGMSTLARSANIVLIAAIPVWLYLQRANWKQLAAATAIAFAPFLLWMIYRRSIPNAGSYLDGFTLEQAITDLGGWPDLLYQHPWRLFVGFTKNLDNTPDALSLCIAIVILVCATYGWWRRARAKKLDAIFFGFYLALILIWPYPREATRFITFVMPLLFLYALHGLQGLGQYVTANTRMKSSASGVLALMVALASAGTIWHFVDLAMQPVDEELRREQREQMYFAASTRVTALKAAEISARIRLTAREATLRIPPGDCVYATLPYLLEMHGPVNVIPYPEDFEEELSVEAQLRRCNYFFIAGVRGHIPAHVPFFPRELLHPWAVPVVMSKIDEWMVAALLVRESKAAARNDSSIKGQTNP